MKQEGNVFQPGDTKATTILDTYYRVEQAGKKIVFANGFFHTEAILKYNQDKDKEKVPIDKRLKFFLADDDYFALEGTKSHTNVVSFKYDIIPAAHQAGVLVGEYFKHKNLNNPKIGFFGGAEPDAVTDFIKGFLAGIETFNRNNQKNTKALVKVSIPKNFDKLLQTGFDASGGKDETKALIADGANVILPVAGPQFRNVITEISESTEGKKGNIKIIGVDVDQELGVNETEKEYYLTSILKNIKDTFYKIAFYIFINNTFDEDFLSEEFKNFKESFLDNKKLLWGKTHYLTVDQKMTGIADIKGKKAWKDKIKDSDLSKIWDIATNNPDYSFDTFKKRHGDHLHKSTYNKKDIYNFKWNKDGNTVSVIEKLEKYSKNINNGVFAIPE